MSIEAPHRRPLVSVAIPVFNGRATVEEAVRSVLAQTHANLEVIVVDDGSTDGTWELLQSFGSSIRAIRQTNSGIAAARNTGIQAARGEFIALMDHDDLCEPERVAAQLQFLLERPEVALCCSDFSAFDARGQVSGSHSAAYYSRCSAAEGGVMARYPNRATVDINWCLPNPSDQAVVVPAYFGMVYEEMALGNFVHPPTVMFRREVLAAAGTFDPEARTMCDWDWLARVARIGAIGFLDRPLLRYRLSASQISSSDRALTDSLHVAQRICARDPTLVARQADRFRKLLGELCADAAEAKAYTQPKTALSLLTTSVLRYRVLSLQIPRTLVKILMPAPLLRLLRRDRASPLD